MIKLPVLSVKEAYPEERRRGRRNGQKVLVHEILVMQIIVAAVIGSFAIAALYWGGQWVLQDNYSRWALQWTEELNELGAPLYLQDADDVVLRLETFITRYPEITRVTYYMEDGTPLHSIGDGGKHDNASGPLTEDSLESLAHLAESDAAYRLESSAFAAHRFQIMAPIWTESIEGDALFTFDPSSARDQSARTLAGFVGLNLDFGFFHKRLLANIKLAAAALMFLLVISVWIGHRRLKSALSSIEDLQQPIAELAMGNLSVRFKPAKHVEISAIVEALATTAKALGERNEKLSRLANHDVLTGLYNRRRFVEELRKEVRKNSSGQAEAALLFVDLDQFKYINDTCGHPAGDRMIRKVADQLQRCVGDKGTVGRFGGDEFTVLVAGVSREGAQALAESILEDLRKVAHVEDEHVFHVHCSIGIAMIDSSQLDHDDLISRADIACRDAKRSGRNRVAFHSMSERESEQMQADVDWVSKLREALDTDSLVLRYQPIVRIATGATTHHEVLLRLRAADGKLISPSVFLPAAVRFGLMAEIDTWLIETAIAELARYREDAPDLQFSLNLSANAFEAENLAAFVRSQLDEHDVPPSCVTFEITESLAMRHLNHVEKQIASLRSLGCAVSLDDFGTGYSSFSYLQKLPVDYIKIDGSFIRDLLRNPVDQKMVRMIGEIGRAAGMKTVAEYVQSGAVFALLGNLGIDYAQGYYVGRPAATPVRKKMPIPIDARQSLRSRRQSKRLRQTR